MSWYEGMGRDRAGKFARPSTPLIAHKALDGASVCGPVQPGEPLRVYWKSVTCPGCRALRVCRNGQTGPAPLADRFWSHVKRGGPDECWPWTGRCDEHGYGRFNVTDRMQLAHRVAWEVHHGSAPPADKKVCHTCDKPPCQNPAHLFLGTHQDNMDDMAAKGRSTVGERSASAKLTETQVAEIRARCRLGERQRVLAAEFGVSQSSISLIASRKNWRASC